MSVAVNEKLMGLMVKAAFFFEPLAPTAISYYLGRKLGQWKNEGLISDYKTHTQRLGKFHYNVQLDLDLNSKQAKHVLENFLPEQTRNLRRWANVGR
jgi:hypothetical protein